MHELVKPGIARLGSARLAIVAAAAMALGGCARGCASQATAIPCETTARPGVATLDTRESSYDAAAKKVVWRGVSRNETKHGLVDLAISLEARRADGTVIDKRTVDVVGMRGKQMLLVPDYGAHVDAELPVGEPPQRIVASILRAEQFAMPADEPLDLEVVGAEKDRLRFQSLGHFQLPSGDATSPFQISLGIRNAGKDPIAALDLQVVFTDAEGREADRLPAAPTFVPALAAGEAIAVELSRAVRPFAAFRVDARGVTLAEK